MALPEDRRISIDLLPPPVQKFVSPSAPVRTKVMVVQGAIPMQPRDHLLALYFLATTNDERVATLIQGAVAQMPPEQIQQIVRNPLPNVVLDWLTTLFEADEALLGHILRNPGADADTYVRLAKGASERLCDQIARNEALLLQSPKIIERLYLNPNLRASVADRLIDLAARNGLVLDIPCYAEVVEAVQGLGVLDAASQAAQDAAFSEAAQDAKAVYLSGAAEDVPLGDDEDEALDEVAAELAEEAPSTPRRPAHQEEEQGGSAAARIRHLNVAQKVRLALMGTKADRSVLIRDSNKVVTRAVIRSPAINESEALGYARLTSLSEEIVAFIAHKRQWTRRYPMKVALVLHPKTPVSVSIQLLAHLRISDLKMVARSHSIPGAVTKEAKAMLKKRMK